MQSFPIFVVDEGIFRTIKNDLERELNSENKREECIFQAQMKSVQRFSEADSKIQKRISEIIDKFPKVADHNFIKIDKKQCFDQKYITRYIS